MACADMTEPGKSQIQSPEKLFYSVTLNHKAVTLSIAPPYNTAQLIPVARNGLGEILEIESTPQFTAADSTVQVSPDGVIQAAYVQAGTSGIRVIVQLTQGGTTHADTAMVYVTSTSTDVARLSLQRPPGDSAVLAATGYNITRGGMPSNIDRGITKSFAASLLNANNDTVRGPIMYYESSRPPVATVNRANGSITGVLPGQTLLRARALVYGVAVEDSLVIDIREPMTAGILVSKSNNVGEYFFVPMNVTRTIRVNGTVAWENAMDADFNVVFDDPSTIEGVSPTAAPGDSLGSGDIDKFRCGCILNSSGVVHRRGRGIRRFPVAGEYPWHSTLRPGIRGTIIVK